VMAPTVARDKSDFRKFQRSYLIVILTAMFSDWIQGPYGYALYASYGFKQGEIAMLYMGGFLSSMVSLLPHHCVRYSRTGRET
jgi:hypothetical protein